MLNNLGTLRSISTDAYGRWSTTYTAPASISGPIDIHARVVGNCGPTYEVVRTISSVAFLAANGPIVGWGNDPNDPAINASGNFEVGAVPVGCDDDDGCSDHFVVRDTCSAGFVAISDLSGGAGCSFRCGTGSARGEIHSSYSDIARRLTVNWTVSGNGAASGSYADFSGWEEFGGAILYRKPSGNAFPAGATLKVDAVWNTNGTVNWQVGNRSNWNGEFPNPDNLISGIETFDIPIEEGALYKFIPIEFTTHSADTWSTASSIFVSVTCENCGD